MKTNDHYNALGVLELMQLLQELHKLGYQKLRWFSYMSLNGCCLRCHITIQSQICAHHEVMWDPENELVFGLSRGEMRTGVDICPYICRFMTDFPQLIKASKGEDPEYIDWFSRLLHYAEKDEAPVFYGEWWTLPLGLIRVGKQTMPTPPTRLRMISWNIDGIKAHFDALEELVAIYNPDIICLQKVKDSKESPEFNLVGYDRACSTVPYGGVATYVRNSIPHTFKETPACHTLRGHFLETGIIYPYFTLYNVYVPYSNPSVKGAVEHRREFNAKLDEVVKNTADRMVICGDMNIVDCERDCWDGKYERNQANFHDWERQAFDELMLNGSLIDTFRIFHYESKFTYFFRNDPDVRAKNQGHRIDYFLASRSFEPQIIAADIIDDCTVSTNNPILLDIRY